MENLQNFMQEDGFDHGITGKTELQDQVISGFDTFQTVLSNEYEQLGFGSKHDSDELEFTIGVEEFLNSDNVLKSCVI